MPNKASSKKALRQNVKRQARNKQKKEAFRSAIKETIKTEKKEDAIKIAHKAQKALDKAAKTGVIKKKTAARKISRLMKKVNKK